MRYSVLLFSLAAAAALGACRRGQSVQLPPPLVPVQINERVHYDDDVGLRDSVTAVVMDRDSLQKVWTRIASSQRTPTPLSAMPKLAAVRFPDEMLLLVAAGRMQREDGVRIDSVSVRSEMNPATGRQHDVLIVQFTIAQGCRRFPDPAYPLEIVSVRRHTGAVRFVGKREIATDCR